MADATYTPPEGYALVTEGEIQHGDFVWNESDQCWEKLAPQWIGDEVEAYYAVARPATEQKDN